MGWKGLMNKINDVMPEESMEKMAEKLSEGQFSLRMLQDWFEKIKEMGPMNQMLGMVPGMQQMMHGVSEKESQNKIQRWMTILDSMTDKELDNNNTKANIRLLTDPSRMMRILRGSGCHPRDIDELLAQYKMFGQMLDKMPKSALKAGGNLPMNGRAQAQQVQQLAKAVPPQMLQRIGGMGGLTQMMKSLEGGEGGMGDLSAMLSGLGGGAPLLPSKKKRTIK